MKYFPLAVLVFVLLFPLGAVIAGINEWTSNGPYGGTFTEFAFDSSNQNRIIASGGNSFLAFPFDSAFRTESGAVEWERTSTDGLVKVDNSKPGALFNSSGDGFFHSTDFGVTWQALSGRFPKPGWDFIDFEISRQNPSLLFAVADYRAVGPAGVFKSTDGGRSWTLSVRLTPATLAHTLQIEIDPRNGKVVYAISDSGKGIKTTDGGASWFPLNRAQNILITPLSLRIDPVNPRTLYAGGVKGIYKTTDAGVTWNPLPCNCHVTSLALASNNSQVIFAAGYQDASSTHDDFVGLGGRVRKSSDGGRTWKTIQGLESNLWGYLSVSIDPVNNNRVFAGAAGRGIFESLDGGNTWRIMSKGIDELSFSRIETGAKAGEVLAPRVGLFQSLDSTATWRLIRNYNPSESSGFEDFQLHTTNPNLVVLSGLFVNGALSVSTNSGKSWQSRVPGQSRLGSDLLSLDPNDDNTVLFTLLDGFGRSRLARSSDLGLTWTFADSGISEKGFISAIRVSKALPSSIYVGTQAGTVYVSANEGKSWSKRSAGLQHCPDFFGDCYGVGEIEISPTNPDIVLINDFATLYRSEDGGRTWKKPTIPAIRSVRFNPSRPSEVVALEKFNDIYLSSDGGATWTLFPTKPGLRDGISINDINIPSWDPNRFLIATSGGIYSLTRQ